MLGKLKQIRVEAMGRKLPKSTGAVLAHGVPRDKSFPRAVLWSYAMNLGERGFGALFSFVLALMVGPSDFGMVAMAMVYILFVQLFLEQGFTATLIQRKDLRTDHLDSVFWMVLASGLALMGVTIALSGRWASVNHVPKLAQLICALSLCIPIEGLDVVQRALFQREMNFKSLSIRSNISVLLGGVVGLGMAFMGYGVWALVGQRLTQDSSALALIWRLSAWRPRFRFSARSVGELLGFSVANFVAKLAVFIGQQSDALLMGIFFGPVAVGLYRLADRLANTCLALATGSLQPVSLSAFSRVQDEPGEIRRSTLQVIRMCSLVTLPPLAGLAAVSGPLMAVLGAKWALSTDATRILCLVAMPTAFAYFTGPLLQATSKPHKAALLVWASAGCGVAALAIASVILRHASLREQVSGIAIARFASGALVVAPTFIYVLLRVSGISLKKFLTTISPALLASACSVSAVILMNLSHLLSGLKPIWTLAIDVAVGGTVGLAALLSMEIKLRGTFTTLITEARQRGAYEEGTALGAEET